MKTLKIKLLTFLTKKKFFGHGRWYTFPCANVCAYL